MEKNFTGMHTCVQVELSGTIEIPSMFLTALGKGLTDDAVWVHYYEPSDPEARDTWGGTILVKSELMEYESFHIKRCAICPITKTEVTDAHGTTLYGKIEIPLRFWEKLGLGELRWASLELESQYISPSARQMEIAIRPQNETDLEVPTSQK